MWSFTKCNFNNGYICKDYNNNWHYITKNNKLFLFTGINGLVYPITNTDFVYWDTDMTFYSLKDNILTELNSVEKDESFDTKISFGKTLEMFKSIYETCEEKIYCVSNGYSLKTLSPTSFVSLQKMTKIFKYDFLVDNETFYQYAFILTLWMKEDDKWVSKDKLITSVDDLRLIELSKYGEDISVYVKDLIFRYELKENKIFKN